MSLCARGVTVVRGGRALLQDVGLDLSAGGLTAILGPNGAGKSTLLAVLSGSLEPDHGEVRLDGLPLCGFGLEALARRRAVLPQLSGLEFPFTVEEVVQLGRHPHGDAGAPSGRRAVARAMAALGLGPLAAAVYPTLSGGERQRAHAARALAQVEVEPGGPAPWLLLDEPTSALDLVHQHALMARVRAFADDGGGAVAVLHDPTLAATYADTLVLLSQGRVAATGPAETVLEPAILSSVYGVPLDVVRLPGRSTPVVVAAIDR